MKQYPTVVNPNIICISGQGGKSTCKGDSGQSSDQIFKEEMIKKLNSRRSTLFCTKWNISTNWYNKLWLSIWL